VSPLITVVDFAVPSAIRIVEDPPVVLEVTRIAPPEIATVGVRGVAAVRNAV
jgi:hypothetical protein